MLRAAKSAAFVSARSIHDLSAGGSEIELPAELEDTRISSGVYLPSTGVVGVGSGTGEDRRVHPGELGMVPSIEAVGPELEPSPFTEVEVFVQG